MAWSKTALKELKELLTIPTAPFRETLIRDYCVGKLDAWSIPYCLDEAGNLLVGVSSVRDYRRLLAAKTVEPLRVFVAHMDHPGFHVSAVRKDGSLEVQWFGGSPIKYLRGSKVWLADRTGYFGRGSIRKSVCHPQGYGLQSANIVPEPAVDHVRLVRRRKEIFGGFAFRKPVWISGQRLYTKAADDLVGVFSILQTAKTLWRSKAAPKKHFIGLLTRAEEVGFVGMVAHLESERLTKAKREVIVVSLEASRTLPGAEIGKGPVVRLGDRRSNFDPQASQLLSQIAERVLKERHQRRVMDGGSCEATAAASFGLRTMGITLPLGNYHNEGYDGGADCPHYRGPAPEYIHLSDLEGMLKLCHALTREGLLWDDPWKNVRQRLQKNLTRYARLL